MSIMYLLLVYENDNEIMREYGHKTSLLHTLNAIMSDTNLDITFKIYPAAKFNAAS